MAPVAKAPTITKADGTVLSEDGTFDFGDINLVDGETTVDVSASGALPISIAAAGSEQLSLIFTNLPSGDYLSFADSEGNAIGARNIDGTVYVVSLSEADVTGDGIIDAEDYIRLVVSETVVNDANIDGSPLRDSNNEFVTTAGTAETDPKPIQSADIQINLTGFALDQVGGTTAQVQVTADGDVEFIRGGDPLIVDLVGDGLSADEFEQVDGKYDINLDGQADTVYMPFGSTVGLLVFDAAGDNFASVEQLSFKDHIFSEYFEFDGQYAGSSLEAISFLDSNSDGVVDSADDRFSDIYVWTDLDEKGVLNAGEVSQTGLSIDLTNILVAPQSGAEPKAPDVFRTAEIQVNGTKNTLYEVALDHVLNKDHLNIDTDDDGSPDASPFEPDTISFGDGSISLQLLDDLGAGPTAAEEGFGSDRTIDLSFTYSRAKASHRAL